MDDNAIEQQIQAKGLTAPRVTPSDIAANIASAYYFTASEAVAKSSDFIPGHDIYILPVEVPKALSLLTFCVLVLRNGFTVTGESACASPENFDAEIGRRIARDNAEQKIWPLMGYELKQQLHFAKQMRELIDIQSHPDTLSAGEYMRGMANGMILAVAVCEKSDPQYIEAPLHATADAPPLDNAHVAPGAERFTAAEIAVGAAIPAYQQRVIDEFNELMSKAIKLREYTLAPTFQRLADAEQVRLGDQLVVMTSYADILQQRIAAF